MKGELQNKRVLVRGKEVFIGVDVHKESWHVTGRTEGEEVFHGGIPSQYHALWRLMSHFKDCRIKQVTFSVDNGLIGSRFPDERYYLTFLIPF